MYKPNQASTIWGRGMYKPNQTPLPPQIKQTNKEIRRSGQGYRVLTNESAERVKAITGQ